MNSFGEEIKTSITFSLSVHFLQKVNAPHVFNQNIELNFIVLKG